LGIGNDGSVFNQPNFSFNCGGILSNEPSEAIAEVLPQWQLSHSYPPAGSKLTREVAVAVLDVLAAGNYREAACQFAGITPKTFRNWLDRAEAPDADPAYVEFAQLVARAESKGEIEAVANVRAAGKDPRYWAADMTFLERRYPERWGRKDRVHSTVDATHKLIIQWGNVPIEDSDDEDDQDDYITETA